MDKNIIKGESDSQATNLYGKILKDVMNPYEKIFIAIDELKKENLQIKQSVDELKEIIQRLSILFD